MSDQMINFTTKLHVGIT